MDSSLVKQFNYATLQVESAVWRIVWYNYHPAKKQLLRVRKTFDLNRVQSNSERQQMADKIVKLVNEALDKGWNYWVDVHGFKAPVYKPVKPVAVVMGLQAALMQALKIRILGKKDRTESSYTSYATLFIKWLEAEGLKLLPVDEFTSTHYQEYLFYKSGQKCGNKNLNQTTFFLRSLFEIMKKNLKVINDNPLADIEKLPEAESTRFVPINQEEISRIVPALVEYNKRFYLFTKFIAAEFIRPWHLARLQCKDINYVANEIYTGGDTAKTNRAATKQLFKDIKTLLIELEYHKAPGNYYLFSNTNFEPGPLLMPSLSNRAAEIWRKVVKEGLNIHKDMYALKHTGAQFFVNENNGVDMAFLKQQMEHSTLTETEAYLKNKVKKKVKESEVNQLVY